MPLDTPQAMPNTNMPVPSKVRYELVFQHANPHACSLARSQHPSTHSHYPAKPQPGFV
eukprot:m.208837 g.208837  ORF g.208837 m.208837 type:complete len:58 (+) comp18541_c1_seq1:251-424(+)